MRKKICSSCGKLIEQGTKCSCKQKGNYKNEKTKGNDDLIRTRKWSALRKEIISRDNFCCQRCLLKYDILNTDNLTVHHIKSRIHFPELVYERNNLITICGTCNNQLGTKDKLDFEWEVPKEVIEYGIY